MHLQEGYWELQRGHGLPWQVRGSFSRETCDIFTEGIIEVRCREEKTAEIALEFSA